MANEIPIFIPILLILAGFIVFYYGFNRMHKYHIISDIPHSKIRSIAMGLVELHGHVNADKCIKTPFSQKDCIYYYYEIEEYSEAGSKKYHGDWVPKGRGEQRIPFFAKDETGSILVDPLGAEYNVSVKEVFLQNDGVSRDIKTIVNSLKMWDDNQQTDLNVSSWGLTPIDIKPYLSYNSNPENPRTIEEDHIFGGRKYYEYYIEPNEQLYVMGTAKNKPQMNEVFIHKGENEPTFIISDKNEKDLLKVMKKSMTDSFLAGVLCIIVGVSILLL